MMSRKAAPSERPFWSCVPTHRGSGFHGAAIPTVDKWAATDCEGVKFSLEKHIQDLEAVVEALTERKNVRKSCLGLKHFVLVAEAGGGVVSIAYGFGGFFPCGRSALPDQTHQSGRAVAGWRTPGRHCADRIKLALQNNLTADDRNGSIAK